MLNINHEKIKHAFIFSLKYGCKNIIANFLALGMDINIKDDEGNSFAHRLAAIVNVNAILFFTKLGVNFNVKNAAGQTPLHLAATFNRTDIIETLLSCGVNINEQDNNGDTCAHIATNNDFRENDKEKANFVAALIKAGADFTIKNNLNEIPLLLAAECGIFMNADLTLRTIISNVEQTGVSNGYIDEIIRIIEKSIRFPEYFFEFLVGKINFNQISETGKLLSNVIVKIGNVEIVRKLIGKVDFNLPACNGYTPILIATAMGYAEIVELLIQQGVNLNHHFICANNNFITLREECANLIQDLLYKEKPIYEEMFMWKNNKTTSFKSFNKKYGTSAAERMNKLLTYKVRLFEDHNQPIAINVGDVAYILGYEKILELLGNFGLNINIFSNLNDQAICFAYDNYVQDYVSAESSDDPVKTLLNVFDDILKESPLPIEEELEEENNTWLDFYEDEEQEIHSKFYKFC